jgi:hypothetical protein
MGRPRKQSSPPPSGAVSIPFNYRPRIYQLPLLQTFDTGKKPGVVVWHRRPGKDKTALNSVVKGKASVSGLDMRACPAKGSAY